MTWEPTFDSGFPSQLFVKLATCAKAWVLSAASCTADAPSPPRPPPKPPILNDAFSKPHICDCLYCAFPRNHLGGSRGVEPYGGRGVRFARSHQSLLDARHFPIDLFNTPPSNNSQIQEPKQFSPNCKCERWYVPIHMNRQNLSKTLKVAKKNLFQVINYLLFLLPVQFIMLLTTIAKK